MTTIGVSSEILEDALHSDLEPSASVREHIVQVRFEAVIWASFNRDADSLRFALL